MSLATPRPLRGVARAVALLSAMLALLSAVPVPAVADLDAGAEGDFVGRINAERSRRGLPALAVRGDLRDVARRHSTRMADQGRISHNGAVASQVCCWRSLGENVGRGPDVGTVHNAFMANSSHRTNILSSTFTQVGVGVERRDGNLWVTQVFREPDSAPPPRETAPPPPPRETAPPPPPPAPPPPPPPPPPPDSKSPRQPATHAPKPRPATPAPARRAAQEAPPPHTPAPAQAAPRAQPPPPAPEPPCRDRASVHLALLQAHVTEEPFGDVLSSFCGGQRTRPSASGAWRTQSASAGT